MENVLNLKTFSFYQEIGGEICELFKLWGGVGGRREIEREAKEKENEIGG